MKKLLTMLLIVSLVFVINGCTKTTDIDDTPSPQSPINGDENGDINENPDTVNDNNTGTTNSIGINDSTGTNVTTGDLTGAGTYLATLRDVDGNLRRTIMDSDANTIDVNDKDYLSKSGDYYRSRAAAYRTALDNLKRTNVDTNNRAYNDSIVSYYQNGYDTYNNLATKYGTFKTTNDETTYRSGLGKDAYDVKTDLRDAYDRALRSLGIDTGTTNRITQ